MMTFDSNDIVLLLQRNEANLDVQKNDAEFYQCNKNITIA